MTTDVDYAQTQAYLQHFRDQGCDAQIVANTEGLFNLCWVYAGMIDELKQALEKKTVSIVRLKEIIFGLGKNHPQKNLHRHRPNRRNLAMTQRQKRIHPRRRKRTQPKAMGDTGSRITPVQKWLPVPVMICTKAMTAPSAV
jgi:hypothetical protein